MKKCPDTTAQFKPKGTITFLFTDIEGSTQLLSFLGDKYVSLLTDHHQLLRAVFAKWNGWEVNTQGDAFFVTFPMATEAVAAVVEAQQLLAEHAWPDGVTVRVRMGLHTGEPLAAEEEYVGIDVHRAARIAHVGHGGQVLLSETTAALVRGNLPKGITLLDLGQHRLKDMSFPEHIHQLVMRGLPVDFPPLRSLGVAGATEDLDLEPPLLSAFLEQNSEPEQPLFVGRERELAWLDKRLNLALQNQGSVIFVTGEAGLGKSHLLQAFARRASERVPELLVTWGAGNAFIGRGDAYLPFRQVLGILSGDVEQPWRSGIITTVQARRLLATIPLTGQIVAQKGRAIATTLVDGRALLYRAREMIGPDDTWYQRLERLVKWAESNPADISQDQLHQQCASVLLGISAEHPLLLLLDDLQWADGASLNLLFHLGRSLMQSRILIVGAYRPEEVALGRDGSRHPLEKVVTELRRLSGDLALDLASTSADEDRAFVDKLLDSEPNSLGRSFRQALLAHTNGQPLFTVEMLRFLQEQSDLERDSDGVWKAAAEVGWDTLPQKVEGVIEERVGRLDDELREVMNIAAVEGENFTAQVVGRVQGVDERQLLRTLSRKLDKQHQLVRERSVAKIGRHLLSRYRFTHALFQQYLYDDLTVGERRLLHADIAVALEELYVGRTDEVAIQLATHFIEAGEEKKALPYLLQAGDQARAMYAHQEAIDVYEQAIRLSSNIEVDLHSRVQIYEQLGDVLATTGRYGEAKESFESAVALAKDPWTISRLYRFISTMHFMQREYEQVHLALDEAEAALQRASPIPPEIWWWQWLDNQFSRMNCYYWCNQIQDMVRLSEEMRPIVEKCGSPRQISKFHNSLANLGFRQERYVLSERVLAHARAAYAAVEGTDELEMINGSRFLLGFSHLWHGWHGDLDEAVADLQAALDTFEEIGDVLMRTRCLNYLAIAHRRRGDHIRVAELLPQVTAAAEEGDLQEYIATAEANLAWLRWLEGDLEATKEHGKEALAIWQTLPGIMPIQWTALWPLIGAAMAQGELAEAVSYAETLLSPDMSRLPNDLVAVLQQAIKALGNDQPETTCACLRTALQLARHLNQL